MSRELHDLIHGGISIPPHLNDIIDTPLFQRLSYITQGTLSSKIFINANHTRKEHCVGVSHLAGKYSQQLFPDQEKIGKILRIGGLLHDIGHGPYSHGWDRTIYSKIYPNEEKGHDEHRKVLLKDYTDILEKHSLTEQDILNGWGGNLLYQSILQGPIGCDRMDFLKRDQLYTNSYEFGSCNIDRIIHNSSIVDTNNGPRLMYKEEIYPNLITMLQNRNRMYENIYYHKTSVGLSILLEEAIKQTHDKLKFVERTKNLNQFVYLTDSIIFEMIPLNEYARKVYQRKILKLEESDVLYSDFSPSRIDHEEKVFIWTSSIFSNDYAKEFSKFDIYIQTHQGPVPFKEYWRNQRESLNVKEWQLFRVYTEP